jgi:hypothetical protein
MTDSPVRAWEDPQQPSRAEWREIAADLRAHPGEWALVHSGSSEAAMRKAAARIKKGSPKAFEPAGDFDAASRKSGDGTTDVYARYVGGDQR